MPPLNPENHLNLKVNFTESNSVIYNWSNIDTVVNNINHIEQLKILKEVFFKNKYIHSKFIKIEINKIDKIYLYEYIKKLGDILISGTNTEDDVNTSTESEIFIIEDFKKEYFLKLEARITIYKIVLVIDCYFKDFNKSTELTEKIKKIFEDIKFINSNEIISLRYYYTFKSGEPEYCNRNEKVENVINQINYPFIENVTKYINDYIYSDASLLFLIGSPGTGKTRFIRYLLSKLKTYETNFKDSIIYFTADNHVIDHGRIFTDFFIEDEKIMVLEDFDFHLDSRKNGNTIMYHLLGLSDGLVQSHNRKIIISSNLTNLNNIDEALLRHGRCFDVLNFRKLTYEESCSFFESNNKDYLNNLLDNKDYSLADLYYMLNNENKREIELIRKVKTGFQD